MKGMRAGRFINTFRCSHFGRAGFAFLEIGEHLQKRNYMEIDILGAFIDKRLSRQATRHILGALNFYNLVQGKK